MSFRGNIQRILVMICWVAAGASLIVLLAAAVTARNTQRCRGYEIRINGSSDGHWFVDRKDILHAVTAANTLRLRNTPLRSIDLNRIEERLRKEVWIHNAELFFDNNGILHVNVKERVPVARILTPDGGGFYVDSSAHRLPLSLKMSARVPVFTSFPVTSRKWRAADRKLVRDMIRISLFLQEDPFWMAQVAQIDITPARQFEMIPTVGNHLIEFGDASELQDKFSRLRVFYKEVLAKAGMDKYSRLKVQYEGQVVGVKKNVQTTHN